MRVTKLNDEQMAALKEVDKLIEPIQNELDILNSEVQQATKVVDSIKDKIRAIRPKLIPFNNEKSRIAGLGEVINK